MTSSFLYKKLSTVMPDGLFGPFLTNVAIFENSGKDSELGSLVCPCFYSFAFVRPSANKYHYYSYLFLKTNTSSSLIFPSLKNKY